MKKEYCHEDKIRKIKIALLISAGTFFLVLVALIIFLIFNLKDSTKSSYKTRGIEYSEIIKKNYIEGFQNCENSQEFSYILPNDDVNELLSIGTKSLKDKHIESIYFGSDDLTGSTFYVDLHKTLIKTRVVIHTVPSIKDENTFYLTISECKVGKANALTYLKNKGYLTSKFVEEYFESCHLPITYDEDAYRFEISPLKWIESFPSSEIGNEIFKDAKTVPNAFSLNSNLFGFNLHLDKLKKSSDNFIDVSTIDTPNLFNEVKDGCITTFDSMPGGETAVAYSLTEEGLNKIVKSTFVSNQKEEITSSLTSNKAVFDIKGVNFKFNDINQITAKLFYSVNGYLIDKDVRFTFTSYSSIHLTANFQVEVTSSNMAKTSIKKVLNDLSNTFDYFSYVEKTKMLSLNLQDLYPEFSDFDLRTCQKWIEVNPSTHCLDFKLTK